MRLRRILAAAAVLIAGGLGVREAIVQSNAADARPVTAKEWDRKSQELFERAPVQAFVAVQDGFAIPQAVGDRILGVCKARRYDQYGNFRTQAECTADPPATFLTGEEIVCGAAETTCIIDTPRRQYIYPYKRSALVAGWRLFRLNAHPWVVGGWKQLAAANSEVRFWAARKDVAPACLASTLTGGQCRNLLRSLDDCWRQADGTWCRNGLHYGPGLGGVDADGAPVTCAVTASSQWFDCSARAGTDPYARSITEDIPADAQLDLDPPPPGGD